jgi:hypothetical protein
MATELINREDVLSILSEFSYMPMVMTIRTRIEHLEVTFEG